MVYRIRYCDGRSPHGAEAVVEAASPTEAIVKFCHTLDDSRDPASLRETVTSISADDCDQAPQAE